MNHPVFSQINFIPALFKEKPGIGSAINSIKLILRNSAYALCLCGYFIFNSVSPTLAQKISIASEAREIEGLKRKGMATLVEFDKKTTERAWTKYLKTLGKMEGWKSGAFVVLAENNTSGQFAAYDLVSRLDATAEGTKIFWSFANKGEYLEAPSPEWEKARVALTDFARQLYRDDLSDQINAAEKVVDVVSKTHDKTVQMGEQLKRQSEKNQADMLNLQKQLEEKRQEGERLKSEITQNKADQESTLEEIKKVRKIAEDKKQKLQGVNN